MQKVPEADNPDIFGLPVNIDRSVQRFNSNLVIGGLKGLAAASAQELRFDKEKWSAQLGPIC
jgi:dynein heavy chain 2